MAAPWYVRDPIRRQAEEMVLRLKFPEFVVAEDVSASLLFAQGTIITPLKMIERYIVRINFPPTYPNDPPRPYCVDPTLEEMTTVARKLRRKDDMLIDHVWSLESAYTWNRHRMLCTMRPWMWNDRQNVVTILARVKDWLTAFEHWAQTGQWVGAEH